LRNRVLSGERPCSLFEKFRLAQNGRERLGWEVRRVMRLLYVGKPSFSKSRRVSITANGPRTKKPRQPEAAGFFFIT
jgi:hypothetical protein